jgi:hypothetical protein
MLFMEASAKTKEGIAQVFNEVVQKVTLHLPINMKISHSVLMWQVLENPALLSNTRPAKSGNRANVNSANSGSSKGGCC